MPTMPSVRSSKRRVEELGGRLALRAQSDERLVALTRAGLEPAFEEILGRYRGQLLRSCRRLLGEQHLAEDALQETFLNAYRALRRGDKPRELRPWLHRIAYHAALDALRRRVESEEALPAEVGASEDPHHALERHQSISALLEAVKELPERQREVILLRELEGRTYEEIAAELGVSGGAVGQLLRRARAALREGATAVTPYELGLRLGIRSGHQPLSTRLAELCSESTAGGFAKACAVALALGLAASGEVIVAPPWASPEEDAVAAGERRNPGGGAGAMARTAGAGPDRPTARRVSEAEGDHDGGGDDVRESRSARLAAGNQHRGSSGGDSSEGGSSSGSSGSGSSGSGSGAGSGSSESGSGAGSGSSGSGGSSSGSSGSGFSRSGSSSGSYYPQSGSSDRGSSGSGSSGRVSSGTGPSGS